jgi:hypothetical protein
MVGRFIDRHDCTNIICDRPELTWVQSNAISKFQSSETAVADRSPSHSGGNTGNIYWLPQTLSRLAHRYWSISFVLCFLISRFFDDFTCGVYLLTSAATGSQPSPTHLSWKKISILTHSPEPYKIPTQIRSSTSGHGSDFAPSKRMLCASSSISRSRPLQRPRPQAPSQTRQWTWRLPNSKPKRHRNAQRLQKVSSAVSEERQSLFTQDGKVYREDHWHPKIMVSHYNPPITASIEPH